MPLYSLKDKDLREHCKRALEATELWMRRLINQELAKCYGIDYLDAKNTNGDRLINGRLASYKKEPRTKSLFHHY